MGELTLSMEAMQTIATAEDIILKQARKQILKEGGGPGPGQLSIQIMDMVEEEDKLTFMVAKGQLGLALGKGARNLQALKNVFNKEVKIVEYDDDIERFVRNCFKPHTVESITVQAEDGTIRSSTPVDTGISITDETAEEDEGDEPAPDTAAEAEAEEPEVVETPASVQTDGEDVDDEQMIRVRVQIKPEDKGKAIGKAGRNINVIRQLCRRHHNIVELKVE